MTLDEAIQTFLHQNLDLKQSRGDITQAEADLITAGLRANPVAFIDTQGVPYGKFNDKTTGGPIQYDFNIVYPLDFSGKRQARTKSAFLSKHAVETKFQDVVRLAIDNLYSAYIDALVAQRNIEFQEKRVRGANTNVLSIIAVDDARETYDATFESLAVLLVLLR